MSEQVSMSVSVKDIELAVKLAHSHEDDELQRNQLAELRKSVSELREMLSRLESKIPASPKNIGAAADQHSHPKSDISDFAHEHSITDVTGLPSPTPESAGMSLVVGENGKEYELQP